MNRSLFAVTLLLLLTCGLALAHDPGLSNLQVVISDTQELKLTFQLSSHDFQTVLSSQQEGEQLQNLRGLAREMIDARLISVEVISSQDGDQEIVYRFDGQSQVWPLTLQVPFLQRLARGHRMYATISDAHRNLIGEALLHAGNQRLMLKHPVPAAAR